MEYISTRGNIKPVSSIEAIKLGMVHRGGLFIPEKIPFVPLRELKEWQDISYAQLASKIFSLFIGNDFTKNEINEITQSVYNYHNFETDEITPVKKLTNQLFIMELFHGPTGAFKDIALQVLPFVLSKILEKLSIRNELVILVATSGDTGKASLEGFKDVKGTHIIVYYPFEKVSKIQELQMLTTEGENTHSIAINGNFDDCQNAVKQIFSDKQFCDSLKEKGFELSSANSINWGRLFPQITYYFYAYLSLLRNSQIEFKEKINFAVPTGNFGNILAAWYAARMGLPVERLVCASNVNNVLTDFFHKGIYNRNRPLISTVSPSMDILISSNLERFLYEISNHREDAIKAWMKSLQETGQFVVEKDILNRIKDIIYAGYASEEETLQTIKSTYNNYNYLVDPHTAVAVKVFQDYEKKSSKTNKTVIDATATPFKFNQSVLKALLGKEILSNKDELDLLQNLGKFTGLTIPRMLKNLEEKKARKQIIYDKEDVKKSLQQILGIK